MNLQFVSQPITPSQSFQTLPYLNGSALASKFATTSLPASQLVHSHFLLSIKFPNRAQRRALSQHGEYRQSKRQSRTRFSTAELLSMEFAEPAFLVKDLLPKGLVMLAGASKLGKSWMALALAYSVASGTPFLGRSVEQGDVLYLALEDTPRRLAERIRLVAPELDPQGLPLEFWTGCPRLDQGGLEEIEEWLKAAQNPQLINIDVWGRFTPVGNGPQKNDYEQVTQHLQAVQALAHKYGVTIVLVHHTRKSNGDGQGGDPFDQVLGSRALTSNMDTTLVLSRSRFQGDATLGITGRDIEEQELAITFDKATYRWEVTKRPQAPALSPERQKVLDVIMAGTTKTGEIVKQVGKERTAVQNLLDGLIKDGVIKRVGKGEYALNEPQAGGAEFTDDMNDALTIDDLEDLI